jgi:hypothetical protein
MPGIGNELYSMFYDVSHLEQKLYFSLLCIDWRILYPNGRLACMWIHLNMKKNKKQQQQNIQKYNYDGAVE